MKKRWIAAALLTLAAALAAGLLKGWPRGWQTLAWLAVTGAGIWGAQRFLGCADRRAQACFGVLGAGLMLAMGLGWRLEAAQETGWAAIGLSMALGVCAAPGAGGCLWSLSRALERLRPSDISPRKVFWISFAAILIGWLPVQLAYFPGCFGFDVNGQVSQLISGEYTTHHPLLHTLALGGLYLLGGRLGSYTLGVWLYVALQMAALAASMAYALSYLARLRCPRGVIIALAAFFALAPNHSLMAIACTKDVPFAAAAVMALVDVHRAVRQPQRLRRPWAVVRLMLWLVLMCLLRNNAAMAIAAAAVVALLAMPRGTRVRLAAVLCASLVLQAGAGAGLKAATGAESGNRCEMFSVPAQQVSRIFDRYGYDVPTSYEVLEWAPHADMYQASRADFTKLHLKVEKNDQLIGFIKFWVREFFHYPIEYIDAFLLNAKGYWFPQDTSYAHVYAEWPDPFCGAIITGQFTGYGVDYTSRFPALRSLYEALFSRHGYLNVPGLGALIHPATYTWMLLWAMAWAVWRKSRSVGAAACLMLAYLLTLLLGPCVLIRYQYPLMLCAPLAAGLLCGRSAD